MMKLRIMKAISKVGHSVNLKINHVYTHIDKWKCHCRLVLDKEEKKIINDKERRRREQCQLNV